VILALTLPFVTTIQWTPPPFTVAASRGLAGSAFAAIGAPRDGRRRDLE
jgi:hypothetical protein